MTELMTMVGGVTISLSLLGAAVIGFLNHRRLNKHEQYMANLQSSAQTALNTLEARLVKLEPAVVPSPKTDKKEKKQ